MRRAVALIVCLGGLVVAGSVAGRLAIRASEIADRITELDVSGARELLEHVPQDSAAIAFERARLAMYQGDCDSAAAILSAPTHASTKEGASLGQVARRCAEATAASIVVTDEALGLWIRLQDEGDQALVPFLSRVAVRSRDAMQRDLGVDLPRPLRLEIVRDAFSLAGMTGLPIEAVETTGTIAVARWGRVIMVTPRATPHGYPWEDTLAHEVVHLALTRASGDHAPLWLQEGVAKREEARWRARRPFDERSYDDLARSSLLSGQSVGLEQLGTSIALLPSADAARFAYAEVASFVSFWVTENGDAALRLLLSDLRGLGAADPNAAMRSVTGFDLAFWQNAWREQLSAPSRHAAVAPAEPAWGTAFGARSRFEEAVRRMRLGDLLYDRSHSRFAAQQLDLGVGATPREAQVRWRSARAWIDAGDQDRGRESLGDLESIEAPCGPWLALRSRFLAESGRRAEAESGLGHAIALQPLSEIVACEGRWLPRVDSAKGQAAPTPADPDRKALCEAARRVLGQD